ncbi:MAG: 23S rRNA (pseudouridine(1915)-N(3))-methyltransferase RlmH [Lachnospiraceae bacterium]|nr:23S rRNA (pseudouridine(1915)-N(3))-methyltransferase RlmH [Lachnospiraceae bacterium]
MKYRILCIGKIKDSYYRAEIENIQKKLFDTNNKLEILEFPDEKIPEHVSEKQKKQILEKEGEHFFKRFTNRDYVVALCIEGKELTTGQHREVVKKAFEDGYESVTYFIGGSLGLSEELKKRSNMKLSFSRMTFPHQLMRMVLCEEIKNMVS